MGRSARRSRPSCAGRSRRPNECARWPARCAPSTRVAPAPAPTASCASRGPRPTARASRCPSAAYLFSTVTVESSRVELVPMESKTGNLIKSEQSRAEQIRSDADAQAYPRVRARAPRRCRGYAAPRCRSSRRCSARRDCRPRAHTSGTRSACTREARALHSHPSIINHTPTLMYGHFYGTRILLQ